MGAAMHVARGATTLGGDADPLAAIAPHQCPNDGKASGESGVTPPLSVDCSEGPGGRCVPGVGASTKPGHYDMKLWTDNQVWNGLNFQMEDAHAFHYNFKWANGTTGFGKCQFTAQAFGDLDGDGVFSTYERAGAADEMGVNAATGLYIDQEVERAETRAWCARGLRSGAADAGPPIPTHRACVRRGRSLA